MNQEEHHKSRQRSSATRGTRATSGAFQLEKETLPKAPSRRMRAQHEDAVDEVRHYFQDLQTTTLLTRAQEITLTQNVERSRALLREELFQYPLAANDLTKALKEVLAKSRAQESVLDDPRVTEKGGRQLLFNEVREQIQRIDTCVKAFSTTEMPSLTKASDQNVLSRKREELSEACCALMLRESFINDLTRRTATALLSLHQEGTKESSPRMYALATLPGEALARERSLIGRFEEYHQHKGELASSNLKLVVAIAKRYTGLGVDFIDLIQEGNLGLIRACEKFQSEKGVRFVTYACWWIERSINNGLMAQRRTIRIPSDRQRLIRKFISAVDDLAKGGKATDDQSIAEQLEISRTALRTLRTHVNPPRSLDYSEGHDANRPLSNVLTRKDSGDVIAELTSAELKSHIAEVLQKRLSQVEIEVLKLRFGLASSRALTHKEIAERFGDIIGDGKQVSHERVRQIEKRALEKLRTKFPHKGLESFIED
ncbi:MAG: sigma-70 family RNA polymerase sigma factor [Bdellovibrionota bacterium]